MPTTSTDPCPCMQFYLVFQIASLAAPDLKLNRTTTPLSLKLYLGLKENSLEEKTYSKAENQLVNGVNSPSTLGHCTKRCADLGQNGQPSPTLGSRCTRCQLVAIAPCIILHWRSAVGLSIGSSYRDRQQPFGEAPFLPLPWTPPVLGSWMAAAAPHPPAPPPQPGDVIQSRDNVS